jgi:hypothetical protein
MENIIDPTLLCCGERENRCGLAAVNSLVELASKDEIESIEGGTRPGRFVSFFLTRKHGHITMNERRKIPPAVPTVAIAVIE